MPIPTVRAATLEELKDEITAPRTRPLVVNHWATWCDPCLVELSHIRNLHKKYGRRSDFLGVSWDLFVTKEDVDAATARILSFVLGHGLNFEQRLYTGTPETLRKAFELRSSTIPITLIRDARGHTVSVFDGPILLPKDIEKFETALDGILA